MGLFKKFVKQTRKPEGFLGKIMLGGMNSGHGKMADWGLLHLGSLSPSSIAELGCGGGRNAGELLKRYPQARVTAVDYSALSVEKSGKYNEKEIKAGRCDVIRADVSALPFHDHAFDLATAFETIYFWPGLETCFAEVFRVLKTGGTFLIVNESNGEDETGKKYEAIIDGMKCYTENEISEALCKAGFDSVYTCRHPQKPWIAVLAKK